MVEPSARGSAVEPALAPFLLAVALLIASNPASAQTLRGTVRDYDSGRGVAGATARLLTSAGNPVGAAVSDRSGLFVIEAPGAGLFILSVEAVGYVAHPSRFVQLVEGEESRVEVELRSQPFLIDPLEVTAQRVIIELAEKGFYDRRERDIGFFLGPEDLEKRPPVNEVETVTRAPFVYPATRAGTPDAEGYGFKMRMLGGEDDGEGRRIGRVAWCDPILIVDDHEVPRNGRIEEFVNFADIVAVEVYRGWDEVPPEVAVSSPFRPESICGLVMVWTNRAVGGGGGAGAPGGAR